MDDVRDGAFWQDVAEHPQVAPHVTMGRRVDMARLVNHPMVTPFRYEGGGFLLIRQDPLGRVHELHTLFKPEAWGREVNRAAKDMFRAMFRQTDVIVTHEVEGWWRSRPPKSFGFVKAADFRATPEGLSLSTWILTKAAWEASPAAKRGASCL